MSKVLDDVSEVAAGGSLDGLHTFDRGVPWVKFKLDREMVLLERDVRQREGMTLVDVGVGWGDYLPYYVARGFRVIALDFQQEDLKRIAAAGTQNGSLSLVAADANQLPLGDSQADVLFMCQVLEHLEDPLQGLQEAYRVLKPGGHLFVDVPFWDQLYRPFSALALRLLQRFKAARTPPLLLRLFFRADGTAVRERTYVKPLSALARSIVPQLKNTRPDRFIEMYLTGELKGDYHRHFYFPGEWCDMIGKSGFEIEVVTGAWITPPPLRRNRLSNRLFGLVEARLGDAALSKIGQVLIVEAKKR